MEAPQGKPSTLRKLRMIASAFSIIAAAVVALSWVGSYYSRLSFSGSSLPDTWFTIVSLRGRIAAHAHWRDLQNSPGWEVRIDDTAKWPSEKRSAPPYDTQFGFSVVEFSRNRKFVIVPHWIVLIAVGIACSLLKVNGRWQFSTRGLLLATTFFAVVLGLGIALDL